MTYNELMVKILNNEWELVEEIQGIHYYHDGAEGFILSVDHSRRRFLLTDFLEMDDFYPHMVDGKEVVSDYQIVFDEVANKLCCEFERSRL